MGNASSTTFGGNITDTTGAGSLVKVGSGTLSLEGTGSSYGGGTTVSNGTLLVNGSLTGSGPVMVAAGATLGGLGSVNGAATVYGKLAAGSNSVLGTLTLNNGLTLAAGATCSFTLGGTYSSGNDQISMSGVLTNNNTSPIIHISAPGTLDTNGNYVLITGFSSLVGGFSSTPMWDVQPANYTNYTVVVSSGQVLLQYSAHTAPTAGITLTPATVSRNQNTLITVTATNGYFQVASVTVDVSTINPSASPLTLYQVGSTKVWTNVIAATAGTTPSTYALTATITDSGSQTATAGALLTVTLANDVWVGGGADALFDTNPNWGNSAAPGFLGDSLTFAGITNLNPSMDNSYSVTSVTFSNNAGSFNIGTANSSTLTLTNSSSLVNNSTNAQTLNVPAVFAAAGTVNAAAGGLTLAGTVDNGGNLLTVTGTSNTTISGIVSDTGGLTKTGNGTLTLSANDSYTGPTTVSGGTLNINASGSVPSTSLATVAAGTLNVSGALTTAGFVTVGSAATNAVLINSGTLSTSTNLLIGNVTNAVGAVYQTGGTVTVSGGGGDQLSVGNVLGGYGYYDVLGGTVTAGGMAVGGENNIGTGFTGTGGNGIMDVNGGTVNDTTWLVMARGATTEAGVLNVLSGVLSYAGGGLVVNWGSGGQSAVINVQGGALTNSLASVGFNLNQSGNATNTGILNLNGGVAQGHGVSGAYGQMNFNGGTLKASTANTAFMTGLASATIYTNGATIDNNGVAITIAQPLLAPTGFGVSSISLSAGGTGYIAPPMVTLNGGNGSGATAIAQINPATGTVTNILVTCAGINYLNTDALTVTFAGGGGSGATANTPVLAALTGGGLTANGTGVLTLAGANTYSGATVVNNGTLQISTEAQLGAVPGSTVTNIVLNGGGLYNNNSTPVLSATRTILLGAGGGYLQAGWDPRTRALWSMV